MSDFVFLADALALDFVNTEVIVRGKRRDLLATPQDLARWWQAAQQHHEAVQGSINVDDGLLAEAKVLRAALRRLFKAVSAGEIPTDDDLMILNATLQRGYYQIDVRDNAPFIAVYRSHQEQDVPLVLARAALQLLTEHDLNRLHHCKNARCILLFYDKSKNSTRRWCSWACMNRARSIAHYRKARDE